MFKSILLSNHSRLEYCPQVIQNKENTKKHKNAKRDSKANQNDTDTQEHAAITITGLFKYLEIFTTHYENTPIHIYRKFHL